MSQKRLSQFYRRSLGRGKILPGALLLVGLLFGFPAARAETNPPLPDFDFTLPLYLGQLEPGSSTGLILYLHFDKQGLAEGQYLPVGLEDDRPVALPPQKRASALAAIIKRFPQAENSPWKAEAVFWNGSEWQSAPALAYIRDAAPDSKIQLPAERAVQVRDLAGESGGFSTGK